MQHSVFLLLLVTLCKSLQNEHREPREVKGGEQGCRWRVPMGNPWWRRGGGGGRSPSSFAEHSISPSSLHQQPNPQCSSSPGRDKWATHYAVPPWHSGRDGLTLFCRTSTEIAAGRQLRAPSIRDSLRTGRGLGELCRALLLHRALSASNSPGCCPLHFSLSSCHKKCLFHRERKMEAFPCLACDVCDIFSENKHFSCSIFRLLGPRWS